MKIRIRNYELILVSLLAGITIAGYLLDAFLISPETIRNKMAVVFESQRLSFHYFTNVLSPQIGLVLAAYLLYLAVNLLQIPQLIISRKKSISQYCWLFAVVLIVTFALALSANIATYLGHPALFSYSSFRLLALFGYNDQPLKDLFFGFQRAFALVAVYLVLACLREYLIASVQRSPSKGYLSLFVNQIALVLLVFILIPHAAANFNLIDDFFFFRVYFMSVTPALLVYLTNMYGIFPSAGTKPWLNVKSIALIVATTFVYSALPMWLPSSLFLGPLWLTSWGIQLFLVTPLTWLIYTQQKDKLLQLRGTEKALVKSKADLQLLRSQINPHFLFNALNTLYGTALIDGSKRTAEGIQKLGDMMRFMLHDNHQDYIPMSSEIHYLKNYTSLQKLRIQHTPAITIEENITSQDCGHLIAPMLLIPFVENAFKHGIHIQKPSWIKIVLACDENTIRFEVTNSVHTYTTEDPEKEHSGIGLENVRERLHLFYQNRHEIRYGSDGHEFKATLVIKPNL